MSLEERVKKIIEENLEEKAEITLETDLRDGLNLDSFAMVLIVNALEEEFGITIDDQSFREIHTVSDIVQALKQRCPELQESQPERKMS